MTTKELTNEEIVTRLLTSNEIIRPDKANSANIKQNFRTDKSLGEFLSAVPKEIKQENKGKYTFINLNSGWKW